MTVKTRLYSLAAAVWAGFYLALYFLAVRRDGNGIAWWYVALVCAPIALTLAAAIEGATSRATKALLTALVLFVLSALMGILTIGLLLVPSIAATAVAVGAVGREPAAR